MILIHDEGDDNYTQLQYEGNRTRRLQTVNVTVFDMDYCAKAYSHTQRRIDDSMFCAGDNFERHDACNGKYEIIFAHLSFHISPICPHHLHPDQEAIRNEAILRANGLTVLFYEKKAQFCNSSNPVSHCSNRNNDANDRRI